MKENLIKISLAAILFSVIIGSQPQAVAGQSAAPNLSGDSVQIQRPASDEHGQTLSTNSWTDKGVMGASIERELPNELPANPSVNFWQTFVQALGLFILLAGIAFWHVGKIQTRIWEQMNILPAEAE